MDGRAFACPLDFDGGREVLHLEAREVGWRYLGVRLYLFASEADYREAEARSKQERPGRPLVVGRSRHAPSPAPRWLYELPPSDVV